MHIIIKWLYISKQIEVSAHHNKNGYTRGMCTFYIMKMLILWNTDRGGRTLSLTHRPKIEYILHLHASIEIEICSSSSLIDKKEEIP